MAKKRTKLMRKHAKRKSDGVEADRKESAVGTRGRG